MIFIDKLESEPTVFINWRKGSADAYRRVSLGMVAFHDYLPQPIPNISDLVAVDEKFFIAWIRDGQAASDLILSRLDPKKETIQEELIAHNVGAVTLLSFEHIGNRGLIVAHHAMTEDRDPPIDVYPITL